MLEQADDKKIDKDSADASQKKEKNEDYPSYKQSGNIIWRAMKEMENLLKSSLVWFIYVVVHSVL